MSAAKRNQIMNATEAVIRREGYRAASVERILAEADVAKMTLYNHFGTKEALLDEVVARMDQVSQRALIDAIETAGGPPADRMARLVDALFDAVRDRGHGGCVFLRTAAEFADPNTPARQTAGRHYLRLEGYMLELLCEHGLAPGDAATRARRIVLTVAGTFALAALLGADAVADDAAAAVRELLPG